jgi:hypothetical protein
VIIPASLPEPGIEASLPPSTGELCDGLNEQAASTTRTHVLITTILRRLEMRAAANRTSPVSPQ